MANQFDELKQIIFIPLWDKTGTRPTSCVTPVKFHAVKLKIKA